MELKCGSPLACEYWKFFFSTLLKPVSPLKALCALGLQVKTLHCYFPLPVIFPSPPPALPPVWVLGIHSGPGTEARY